MLQKIISKTLRALNDYNMIEDGDKIAVGLSGGKDSIALLYALHYIQKFYDKKFEFIAITIHSGSELFKTDELEKLCKKLNIPYVIYMSDIEEIVFNVRKEKNPCSLCANLRRGMLSSVAVENGCNKIALGHHLDDIIETFLLNLYYNGNIHTFAPVTHMSRSDMKVIRPFIYVEEKQTYFLSQKENYPVVEKRCKADGHTKRDDMDKMIRELKKNIPRIKENLFGAIKRSEIKGWKKDDK